MHLAQARWSFRWAQCWPTGSSICSQLGSRVWVQILFPFSPPLPGSSGTFCAQPQERTHLNQVFWASASPHPCTESPCVNAVITLSPRL